MRSPRQCAAGEDLLRRTAWAVPAATAPDQSSSDVLSLCKRSSQSRFAQLQGFGGLIARANLSASALPLMRVPLAHKIALMW